MASTAADSAALDALCTTSGVVCQRQVNSGGAIIDEPSFRTRIGVGASMPNIGSQPHLTHSRERRVPIICDANGHVLEIIFHFHSEGPWFIVFITGEGGGERKVVIM